MPDWIAHILFALIIAEIVNLKRKGPLLLGTLLPDFLTKVYLLNYFFVLPWWFTFDAFIFHRFMPILLAGILVALFFKEKVHKAMVWIWIGSVVHILLDKTTKHFFTDSWYRLIWGDQYWIATVVFAVIYILILLIKMEGKNED